jgi:NADH-quinone oxidoreductase subunit M
VKRLVAYSSISHLGFAVLGVFVFTQTALSGSVLEMVNHGLTTAALFLLVQMVADRTLTRDVREMGGMGSVAPRLAGVFLIVALASIGLPGLNHFVGEWLVILGSFAFNHLFAALAATGIVLSAIYLLWAYQRMMQGPLRAPIAGGAIDGNEDGDLPPPTRIRPDLRRFELALLVPLIAMMVFIGVYPKPFLDRINPSTARATHAATAITPSSAGTGQP